MIAPFDRALAGLRDRLGDDDVAARVARTHVRGDGALVIDVGPPQAPRWFRWRRDRLTEIHPPKDGRLPLARRLDGALEVLAYRPGRRLVVAGGPANGSRVIKGYRPRRLAGAVERHRLAHEAFRATGLVAPTMLEVDEASASVTFERIGGEPIAVTVANAEPFFRLGAGLRTFQDAAPAASPDALGSFSAADEIAVLDRLAGRTAFALGVLPEGWHPIRCRLRRAVSGLPPATDGLAHRDLHDRQLLSTATRPAVLDFDLLCRGDVALDPANLLAHLTLRALQGLDHADERGALACGEAFLDGLERGRDEAFWPRLRFYQATTFLRLALVYRLRPRWSGLVPSLIVLAARCTEDIGS